MKEEAKKLANKVDDWIGPYKKYIGLVALMFVLDYFVFNGRMTAKVKEWSEKLYSKASDSVDKAVDKLCGEVEKEEKTSTPEEGKDDETK